MSAAQKSEVRLGRRFGLLVAGSIVSPQDDEVVPTTADSVNMSSHSLAVGPSFRDKFVYVRVEYDDRSLPPGFRDTLPFSRLSVSAIMDPVQRGNGGLAL